MTARAPADTGAEDGALAPGLYVVGTPIGNLLDITLRALDTLRRASLILAEDTRQTRILLDRHGIRVPLLSAHKFNEAARIDSALARLRAGAAVALVTDSGTPAVSDPGARLVAACRAAGFPVFVVPGPSAATAAVSAAGIATRGFVFGGFLPAKSAARRRALATLGQPGLPLVLFESPHRLLKLLDDLEAVWGAPRVYIGRELTKRFEEHLVGTPAELRAALGCRSIRGELTLVVVPGPMPETEGPELDADEADLPSGSGDEMD
ncbi:MAG: 16S rRNA (cytidine(1402)-2'-O)-methyltransferase [Kiritimatiellae bacterium]|nr:16S rRNA (cytidine(1402)-2'-O)-methyltransferase [Kiritimatiellia bacterium]MDW8457757.1 16S rRNA (cytidine(1402)-2'-O)-methyltransferase [Verrucomicrobiota bacterium]